MIIDHIFFDLDRTLWDFDQNSHEALSQIFDKLELNGAIQNKRAFISDYKRINEQMWTEYRQGLLPKEELRVGRFMRALKKYGVDDYKIAEIYSESYIALCPHLTLLFPNTIETLEELKARGKKLHIITNGFSEVQHLKLQKSNLESYFDVVICSDAIGINKPEPGIFHEALKQAGAKSATSAMIGDHLEIDVLGANQVGMQGILFDPKREHKNLRSVKRIENLREITEMIY
jgi:putative hydrolase of the HAD superfamily